MNQRIFNIHANFPTRGSEEEINEHIIRNNLVPVDAVAQDFYFWCMQHLINKPKNTQTPVTSTVAGKNYTDFDKPFL